MKKLLMITRNFPPLVGGMEKLNKNICEILSKYYCVTLLGPAGARNYVEVKNVEEFAAAPAWLYLLVSIIKAVVLGKKHRFDLVFCGSGSAIIAGYLASKITSAPLICYLHGLDIVVKNKIYQWLFIPLIKKSHLIFVNSQNTMHLAESIGVDVSKIKILHPGVDLPNLIDRPASLIDFRNNFNLGGGALLLIVGRMTERKGIPEFIINVMPSLVNKLPDLQLVIVGSEPAQALKHKKGTAQQIADAVAALNLDGNVKCVGSLSDELLKCAYFSADLMIFPVLDLPGDIEGFGMVAVEAAAHCLPTVGFSVGGVSDAILEKHSGWLIESGNYSRMYNVILARLLDPLWGGVDNRTCIEFASKFEWDIFEKKLECYLRDVSND